MHACVTYCVALVLAMAHARVSSPAWDELSPWEKPAGLRRYRLGILGEVVFAGQTIGYALGAVWWGGLATLLAWAVISVIVEQDWTGNLQALAGLAIVLAAGLVTLGPLALYFWGLTKLPAFEDPRRPLLWWEKLYVVPGLVVLTVASLAVLAPVGLVVYAVIVPFWK